MYDSIMEGFNYHHLHYFWVVAREGSIARASQLLKLAQPTISAQVHELEASLGQKLFARAGRGLALTEAGQKVYGFAEQIFHLGNEMVDAVHGRPGQGQFGFEPAWIAGCRGPIAGWQYAGLLRPQVPARQHCRAG